MWLKSHYTENKAFILFWRLYCYRTTQQACSFMSTVGCRLFYILSTLLENLKLHFTNIFYAVPSLWCFSKMLLWHSVVSRERMNSGAVGCQPLGQPLSTLLNKQCGGSSSLEWWRSLAPDSFSRAPTHTSLSGWQAPFCRHHIGYKLSGMFPLFLN